MVVEHLTYNPKMEGLNPASTGRELLLVSGERHLQKRFYRDLLAGTVAQ